ncbi:Transcription factor AP-4, partial [Stegodyphus mimosarum]
MINSQSNQDSDGSCSDSPLPKRKKRDTGFIADSTDEGIGSSSPRSETGADDSTKREVIELRMQLERERELRIILQEQCRSLESQLLGDDGAQEIANLAPLQYHSETEDCGRPPTSALRIALENGLGSPQSHTSNQESPHELPLRESSPELSSTEVPEDLSGKSSSVLLPCVSELSISDAASIPGILISSGSLSTQPPFTVETDIIPQKVSYKA